MNVIQVRYLGGFGMKRVLVILLSFMVLLSVFAFPVTAQAYTISYWTDGLSYNPAYSFSGGSGGSGDPYLIGSATDLAQLAFNVNNSTEYSGVYFMLSDDINLAGKDWVPIGTASYAFRGNFEGNYKTISNLNITGDAGEGGALFNYASNASFSNLTVAGSITTTGICAMLIQSVQENVSITNCSVSGTVTSTTCLRGWSCRYISGFC